MEMDDNTSLIGSLGLIEVTSMCAQKSTQGMVALHSDSMVLNLYQLKYSSNYQYTNLTVEPRIKHVLKPCFGFRA